MGRYRIGLLRPLFVGLLLVGVVITAQPAGAITGGQRDEVHTNVGVVRFTTEAGRFRCSGTLISPTVVLTAGHCTRDTGESPATDVYVSFNTDLPLDPLAPGITPEEWAARAANYITRHRPPGSRLGRRLGGGGAQMGSHPARTRVVTVNEVLAGHTVLDLESLDRIYLNGWVNGLQVAGQVVRFLHNHRGMPIASPAVFEQIGTRFRHGMERFARTNHIPWVRLAKGAQGRGDAALPAARRAGGTPAGGRDRRRAGVPERVHRPAAGHRPTRT
jgi:hypothetical protein